jgi:hypothetical protein
MRLDELPWEDVPDAARPGKRAGVCDARGLEVAAVWEWTDTGQYTIYSFHSELIGQRNIDSMLAQCIIYELFKELQCATDK